MHGHIPSIYTKKRDVLWGKFHQANWLDGFLVHLAIDFRKGFWFNEFGQTEITSVPETAHDTD